MEITELVPEMLGKIDLSPQPRPNVGRFYPSLSRGKWGYEEEWFPAPAGEAVSPPLSQDSLEQYAQGGDLALFLAKEGDACLGYIALEKDFMGWAYVEILEVAAAHRGKSVGTALIQKAVRWAKELGAAGLRLEAQDSNLMACRFYLKQGFQIGGVNTLRYHTLPAPKNQEAAVLFYLLF